MSFFTIAPAQLGDATEILALQNANHVSNVSVEDLAGGFVTTELTQEMLAIMAAEVRLWTARDAASRLAAYACAVPWGYYGAGPFQDAARALFPLALDGRVVTVENSFQYGPVCVAAKFRGQGALEPLIAAIREHSASAFEFGITFIDVRNLRSLAAHERKLGFRRLALLPYASVTYHLLGFACR